jgi:FAD/FMN-containing dehydrogenase
MQQLTILTVCILATVILTKTYTLRGDALWPTAQQIAAFKASLTGPLVLDTDANYKPPSTYNIRAGPPQPAFLVKPANEDDIAKSLAFASTHGIRVSIRSTGHHFDLRNTADQSIQLDMSYAFNKNTIDIAGKTVTVQPGQAFSEVHKLLKRKGMAH